MSTAASTSSAAPLAETWADLLYRLHRHEPGFVPDAAHAFHCDVLIVGSGYGGAVSAAALSETLDNPPSLSGPRIWLLERGRHRQPGEFPGQMADLAGHVRFNTPHTPDTLGRADGLFDIRVGEDASVIVANGLGGGSLINAGVMAWPQDEVFAHAPWPPEIHLERHALRQASQRMKQRLGAARPDGQDNTVREQAAPLRKHQALARVARSSPGSPFVATPITMALREGELSSDNVQLKACKHCGDCATGCNHGAKISLDTNLLHQASRRGVRLFTGATVMHLSPHRTADGQQGWAVHARHTDNALQWRESGPALLTARRVILAAGSLGSTGILLRSRGAGLQLSDQLGEGFSGNGDLLMAVYGQHEDAGAIADEADPPERRRVGPTITGMIDQRRPAPTKADLHRGYVIQELAIPGPLQRVFAEVTSAAQTLGTITTPDWHTHRRDEAQHTDPAAIDTRRMRHTLPLAMIGHDDAQGRLLLVDAFKPHASGASPDERPRLAADSALTVQWPSLRTDPRFDRQIEELKAMCASAGTGGTVLPNPIWKLPLPGVKNRGPLMIAHPLGGCRMGRDRRDGVVNHKGQVFDASQPGLQAVHEGLVVLDGAMIPSSLGINPSLTIATLSERAIGLLIAQDWAPLPARRQVDGPIRPRPQRVPAPQPAPDTTSIEITEQMRGWVGQVGIELTLRLKPVELASLTHGKPFKRPLAIDPSYSRVRVIQRPDNAGNGNSSGDDGWLTADTLLEARLTGHLFALHREDSVAGVRIARGLWAWFCNRGLRDIAQALVKMLKGIVIEPTNVGTMDGNMLAALIAMASRAGEVRLMEYDLRLGEVLRQAGPWQGMPALEGQPIQGRKRITYARRANLWKQLTEMRLDHFPGLQLEGLRQRTLSLNMAYLAELGIPLLRILNQRDLPSTLAQLASLATLFARLLAPIHAWSLRPPDKAIGGSGQPPSHGRLPGSLPGRQPPDTRRIPTGHPQDARGPSHTLLTRYHATPGRPARAHPIVMLHGYSASGTSFAHPALRPGLAPYLADQGHDVWIADLRSSPGLKATSTLPWTFEDMALQDIPLALAHVAAQSPSGKVNVLAHCMGSAMLWMALLAPHRHALAGHPVAQTAMDALQGMKGGPLIHRLCMSQVSPIIHFSDANMLRAFMLRYVRQFLPLGPYHFEAPAQGAPNEQILSDAIDMLLATLPYPDEDWDKEHPNCPPWRTTPWARTRRRMDMLYGRTFNLPFMSKRVLDCLDDLFGPMNLNTLAQVLHIARCKGIADATGHSIYLNQGRVMQAMDHMDAMLSVHGQDNGLSDISGTHAFKAYVDGLGPRYAARYQLATFAGRGHQDCLIGEGLDAPGSVFDTIDRFFH